MPKFTKDELKKKDEQKLDEMQDEIDEAEAEESAEDKEAEAQAEEGAEEAPADDLQKKVDELTAALQKKDDQYLRLQADYQNYRRRTAKEKAEIADVVTQNILKDLLPMLDNFERAMGTETKDIEAFKKGVEMIYTQFQEVLKKDGLEYIETAGKKFDPNFHQAVMRVQNDDLEDGTIAMELQKGYQVKGRVIRPSMVQVVSN